MSDILERLFQTIWKILNSILEIAYANRVMLIVLFAIHLLFSAKEETLKNISLFIMAITSVLAITVYLLKRETTERGAPSTETKAYNLPNATTIADLFALVAIILLGIFIYRDTKEQTFVVFGMLSALISSTIFLFSFYKKDLEGQNETKTDEKKKNDGKGKAKETGFPWGSFFIFLSVLLTGYFWGSDVSSAIREVKSEVKSRIRTNGTLVCWDADIKTGKSRPPVTSRITITKWNKSGIEFEAEYENMKKGEPTEYKWDKKNRVGTWKKSYPKLTGTWWIPETDADGLYSGWTGCDQYPNTGSLSLILKVHP